MIRTVVSGLLVLGMLSAGLGFVRILKWSGAIAQLRDGFQPALLALALASLGYTGTTLYRLLRTDRLDPVGRDLRVAFTLLALGSLGYTAVLEDFSSLLDAVVGRRVERAFFGLAYGSA